jgi:hypothetical protein
VKKVKHYFIAVIAVSILVPSISFAAQKVRKQQDDNGSPDYSKQSPGGSDYCGLGWQVTDKKSFLGTTTRGTTNSVVPPTFGMTSGTIGCDQHSFAKADENAVIFVATNSEQLSVEMAQGKGEFLEAFARTLGCDDSAMSSFGRMTQKNYQTIMSGRNGIEIFKNVKTQISDDPALSIACKSTV